MGNSFLFLGTGSSMGVPVIGCQCSVCRSTDPHNHRMRPSGLLTVNGKNLLIDAGPDYRYQALKHQITEIDGLILTHGHHDHTAGVDDLRAYTLEKNNALPVLLSEDTLREMQLRFSYIFLPKDSQKFTTKVKLLPLEEDRGSVSFLGLSLRYFSYFQMGMKVTGIRYGNFAYVTDIREYPETIFEDLKGIEILVVSALRFVPTKMHFSIDEAIEFSRKTGAKMTYLTHISHELDHDHTNAYLPANIKMSYDGMVLNF